MVKRFHSYLLDHIFELITDHQPLLALDGVERKQQQQKESHASTAQSREFAVGDKL